MIKQMTKWLIVSLLFIICSLAVDEPFVTIPKSTVDFAIYPDWAHDHWVWLSSAEANQDAELAFVKGFLDRNVTVGAVNIDSKWSNGINNFLWDEKKYPDAKVMVESFHNLGLKVILWVTSVVNEDASNFAEGKAKGYFLNNGSLIKWWHGHGAFIDYTNEDALSWWHQQMDAVIDIGIDGWKCDGTDPYVFEFLPYAYGKNGRVTEREYADFYYRDFFYYTRSKNPQTLIMSRPVDMFGPIWWDFSPRDVMFSGWVGDQDPTFSGLQAALYNMFRSAFANYPNYGSDIGGYRGGGPAPHGRTKTLFIRWAQMGAFVPLMENGGDNEHRPWKFDNTSETLDIYRTFVNLHMELKPYLLTAGSTAYEQETSVIKPIVTPLTILNPYHSWDYLLWRDIFVAPIVEDSETRKVIFPKGEDWVDYFNPNNIYTGGVSRTFQVTLGKFPVYHRRGSMLPLYVSTEDTGHGSSLSKDHLTVLIHPVIGSDEHLIVRRWGDYSSEYFYTWKENELAFKGTSHNQPLIIILRSVKGCPVVHSHTFGTILPQVKSLESLHELPQGILCESSQTTIRISNTEHGTSLTIKNLEML